MYCPGCGIDDKQGSQYCRACGTDLRVVRASLETPDSITASAVSAREEIGRAVAAKIRETQSTYELKKVVEDVLPEIEKFLESPEERRLRRMRVGMIISSIGLGAAIAMPLIAIFIGKQDLLFLGGMGLITFFIGLGFVLSGVYLTVPKKEIDNRSSSAQSQAEIDSAQIHDNDLLMPEPANLYSSVTENTTRHLEENRPNKRSD
ncbi:MAG: hypothetical protein ABI999_08735 [Acidobacteriota bacterium]